MTEDAAGVELSENSTGRFLQTHNSSIGVDGDIGATGWKRSRSAFNFLY